MSGGQRKPTAAQRLAYEQIKGVPFPDPWKPQDIAIAQLCHAQVVKHRRAEKAAVRRAKQTPLLDVKDRLEVDEQKDCARWFDGLGLCWIHIPNEGKRTGRYGASLKQQGLKPGFPDILIFTPPPNHPDARFVAIELKRQTGGRVSDNQREWLSELRENGGISQVCNGFAEVKWFCESLGYGGQR